MNAVKAIAILFIVSGVVCEDRNNITTTVSKGNETDATFFENFTTPIVGSKMELTSETVISNQTDIDTSGDIIITSEPENNTNSPTPTDRSTAEIHTVMTSTEPEEITTVPVTPDWSACSFNPCKNGGSCEKDPSDPNRYNCNCTEGYTGTHCQVLNSCIPVENEICLKGACFYGEDGLSKYCSCFFGMSWDDDLKECRDRDPPCFPNPCSNGICIQSKADFYCSCNSGYDGKFCDILNQCVEDACENGECVFNKQKKLKYCQCHSDFFWNENSKRCETFDLPCHPNPCKNQGTCEAVSSSEFNCTCAEGFIGQNCEIEDLCVASNNGTEICGHGDCVESKDMRECRCNEGYYLDKESRTCKKVMEPCLPNPCSNEGKCTPLDLGSFNCTCSEGYTGPSCSDFDYCVLKGGNTFCRDAQCQSVHSSQTYYCSCASGQYFVYGTRTCIDIDFCPLMKCGENEECTDSTCDCKENYKRDNSTGKCEAHFCVSNPCPVDDLICTEGDGIRRYKCACKSGYAFNGTHCNAGAICLFPTLNSCHQKCTAEEEGYVCGCVENHFVLKDDNKTCEYIGNATCSNKTCDHGVCLNTEDGEMCICPPGYQEVNDNCVDLCLAGHLPEGYCPGNQCESVDSGFRCKCEGKYTLSSDGVTCTARRMCHEGAAGSSICSERHAICLDDWLTPEGFRCQCRQGMVEEGYCQDICDIEENQKQCSVLGAECDVDANGEKTCKCPPFFQTFRNGTACNKLASFSYLLILPLNSASYKKREVVDTTNERSAEIQYVYVDYDLVQKDVRKALENIFPEMQHSNVLNCKDNLNSLECKVEMQLTSITEEGLKRISLPEVCHTNVESSPVCLLPPSLLLRRDSLSTVVSVKRTDPCDVDIKEDLCGSETFCTSSDDKLSFKCRCEAGFTIRGTQYPFGDSESFIQSCKDIDECAVAKPCSDNMECHNTLGSYTCSCLPGFRPKDTQNTETSDCVEICNPNPCVHGECSKAGDHDFECRCAPGYSGILCDSQDENFKRARTNTIVVGAVLGGALLVVVILSITSISRIKKKKRMLEDSDRILYGTEMTERRGNASGNINNAYQRE